jgi:hypothetical protein
MSEHENQWTKALAENGTYDLEKARQAGETAASQYLTGLKKTERILWIYLVGCVIVAVVAFDSLVFATSNKAMMASGMIFLVAIETTILMKLWYWIVNTKLTLQKEIRQSQLQRTVPDSTAYSPTWFAEMSLGKPGLSRWERMAWLIALTLGAAATSGHFTYSAVTAPTQATVSESIRLSPNGTSSSKSDVSYRTRRPVESIPFYCGCESATFCWLDERGRQLPFDVATTGGQRCFTVYLIEPVGMGEWLRYTEITEVPSMATCQGDLWTFENGFTWGFSSNRFLATVELPRGAKVVSVDPQPVQQSVDNDVTKLVFSAARDAGSRFQYKVQYRLAQTSHVAEESP